LARAITLAGRDIGYLGGALFSGACLVRGFTCPGQVEVLALVRDREKVGDKPPLDKGFLA
jgi:hypothetical protein